MQYYNDIGFVYMQWECEFL